MSTNCIDCIKNKRTGLDLLCDDCRIKANAEFLFKFFELGYDCAVRTLQNTRSLVLNSKVQSMREYFEQEAKKQGLL